MSMFFSSVALCPKSEITVHGGTFGVPLLGIRDHLGHNGLDASILGLLGHPSDISGCGRGYLKLGLTQKTLVFQSLQRCGIFLCSHILLALEARAPCFFKCI